MFRFIKRIRVLPKYLVDKNISVLKKMLVAAMLFYVFSPLDLLPDPILGFGFIDDAVIAIYIVSMISNELDKYLIMQQKSDFKFDKDKVISDVEYEIKEDYDEEKKI